VDPHGRGGKRISDVKEKVSNMALLLIGLGTYGYDIFQVIYVCHLTLDKFKNDTGKIRAETAHKFNSYH